MGVGAESRAGLPRDGSGHRCIARGRDRPFATREGSAVGGGYGSALRDGGVEQLRVWRGGAVAPEIRRDGGTHQYGGSALVCGQLQSLQRPKIGRASCRVESEEQRVTSQYRKNPKMWTKSS